jgi:hypothetical protein
MKVNVGYIGRRHSKRIKPIDAHSFTKRFLETMIRKRPAKEDVPVTRNVSLSSLSSLVASSWKGVPKKGEPHALIQNTPSQASLRTRTAGVRAGSQPPSSRHPIPPRPASFIGGWTDMLRKRGRVPASSADNTREEEPAKKTKQAENILGRMRSAVFLSLSPAAKISRSSSLGVRTWSLFSFFSCCYPFPYVCSI